MHAKRILMLLGCLALFSSAGASRAEPEPQDTHSPALSASERMRMRGDLERFSQQHPYRNHIEMRRQLLRERAKRRFLEADLDDNGFLNRQEFARHNPNAARQFDLIDRNRDGELSEMEVAQALRRHMRRQALRDHSSEHAPAAPYAPR